MTLTPTRTGLKELAHSGKAKATLDLKDDHVSLHSFHPPPGRLSTDPGVFSDSVWFGKYKYLWSGHDFIVYATRYTEGFTEIKTHYILHKPSSPSDLTSEGRDSIVEDLIATASRNRSISHNAVFVYDQEEWTRSTELFQSVKASNWEQVILDPKLKGNLINDVEGFFSSQSSYKEFAVPWKRGIIIHGLPGNGKTISIKAMMNSLYNLPEPVPTLYVKSLAGCHGPHYSIREIFVKARETAPCLLVFEDLDSLISDKVKSFFLNEVDGLESNDGIMMIGSTNYLERLDAGITKRPSRFDRKYHFTLPAREERIKYAEFWRAKLSKNKDLDFSEDLCTAVADITEGFSFAYLKELFVTSLLLVVAAKRGDGDIDSDTTTTPSSEQNANGDSNEGKKEINGVTTTTNNQAAEAILEDSSLGKLLMKQVKTLRVELEEAMKSAEDANGDGKKGKNGEKEAEDEDCEDCIRPFPRKDSDD